MDIEPLDNDAVLVDDEAAVDAQVAAVGRFVTPPCPAQSASAKEMTACCCFELQFLETQQVKSAMRGWLLQMHVTLYWEQPP